MTADVEEQRELRVTPADDSLKGLERDTGNVSFDQRYTKSRNSSSLFKYQIPVQVHVKIKCHFYNGCIHQQKCCLFKWTTPPTVSDLYYMSERCLLHVTWNHGRHEYLCTEGLI